jgi:hypothetical protein
MSVQMFCLLVVAAMAGARVFELNRKKKVSDNVATEQGEQLVVTDGASLVPEQVRKAAEKANKGVSKDASEDVKDTQGAG